MNDLFIIETIPVFSINGLIKDIAASTTNIKAIALTAPYITPPVLSNCLITGNFVIKSDAILTINITNSVSINNAIATPILIIVSVRVSATFITIASFVSVTASCTDLFI